MSSAVGHDLYERIDGGTERCFATAVVWVIVGYATGMQEFAPQREVSAIYGAERCVMHDSTMGLMVDKLVTLY